MQFQNQTKCQSRRVYRLTRRANRSCEKGIGLIPGTKVHTEYNGKIDVNIIDFKGRCTVTTRAIIPDHLPPILLRTSPYRNCTLSELKPYFALKGKCNGAYRTFLSKWLRLPRLQCLFHKRKVRWRVLGAGPRLNYRSFLFGKSYVPSHIAMFIFSPREGTMRPSLLTIPLVAPSYLGGIS